MANEKLKCENCGFEEELTAAQAEERKNAGTYGKCGQCGAEVEAAESAARARAKAKSSESKAEEVMEDAGATAEEAKAETKIESKIESKADAAKESAKQAAEQLKKAFAASRNDPVFLANLIDKGTRKLTGLIQPEGFDKNANRAITLGHYVILLLALLSLVMGIILSFRMGTAFCLLVGASTTVILLLAQYVAIKSFNLFDGVISTHPSKLSGPGLVEILAIANIIGAVGGIVAIIIGIVNHLNFAVIAYGLSGLVFGFLIAVLLMHADKHLNVSYDPKVTLGEQLLGLASVNIKAVVKIVPYIFGFGLTIVTVMCIPTMIILLARGFNSLSSLAELLQLLSAGVLLAFSPILIYALMMAIYLSIDLLRSILSLGKK